MLDNILRDARVFLGGGSEVAGSGLRDAAEQAGRSALERLYPRFSEADSARWPAVLERARKGNADALSRIGYEGDAEKHVVSREVLAFVGPGRKGREVRAKFEGPPFGWSQDAIDAAIFVLVGGGHLRASVNGSAQTVRTLDQKKIGTADFRSETLVISMAQRLKVRKLFTEAGVQWRSDEEPRAARRLVEHMLSLAHTAGGDAPLPAHPDASHLQDLKNREGNELILGVYSERDRLREELAAWNLLADKARERLPEWRRLEAMLGHAGDITEAEEIAVRAGAIRTGRVLLDEPNPATPLLGDLRPGTVLSARLRPVAQAYGQPERLHPLILRPREAAPA